MIYINQKDSIKKESRQGRAGPPAPVHSGKHADIAGLFRSTSSPIPGVQALDFELPPELEAHEPPEARGLARDEVRLMVSYRATDRVVHTRFRELPRYLGPGD